MEMSDQTLLSLQDAAEFANLAYENPGFVSSAYHSPDTCTSSILRSCVQLIASEPIYLHDDTTGLRAYVMKLKGPEPTLLVCIRGTSSLEDCFIDVQVRQVPFHDQTMAKVHSGFLKQYESLAIQLEPTLKEHMTDDTNKIIFVGHSLASGVATIAALSASLRFSAQRVVFFGFGSPKVGNQAFANLFKSNIVHCELIKHACDPICKIMVGDDYVHVRPLVCYGCYDMHESIPLVTDIGDHNIVKYITSIQNNESSQHPALWQQVIQRVLDCIVHLFS